MDRDGLLVGYRYVRDFSFPRRFPVIQFPNAPLIIAFAGGQLAALLHGVSSDDARAISYLAMTVWAYEELAHGVNWFRHLLGLAYVVSTAFHLSRALSH
ncbi:MAG TPA: hypothetical protein VHV75_11080 [Solirubrobacteraceae bacterium]|nr:hypothetical protein [Solirubrobacteraceae bacterium]